MPSQDIIDHELVAVEMTKNNFSRQDAKNAKVLFKKSHAKTQSFIYDFLGVFASWRENILTPKRKEVFVFVLEQIETNIFSVKNY